MTVKKRVCTLTIILLGFLNILWSQNDSTRIKSFLKYGGALRYNYNLSSWKPNQVSRGGDFGFEVFRINVDAGFDKWEIHLDQRFYSSGFGGAFLKYGWFQYALNSTSHIKVGLIPSYFGTQQFNSNSWFFQLPFYLGFEDDHDMGISYDIDTKNFTLDIAYYKNSENLTFSDNSPISDSRYNYDFSGRNKEVNQFNLRFNYKFGEMKEHKIGTSFQYGGIWNLDTKSMGSHIAIGLHSDFNFGPLNIKTQYLNFNNKPQNEIGQPLSFIEMTAYGAPYNTAAKAVIYSMSISYKLKLSNSFINSIQFYNDYSYMDKSEAEWEDSQMNVLGMLIDSNPLYIYVDYAMGLHQPWLGPQWTDALTTGDPDNSWEARLNINFGYYF